MDFKVIKRILGEENEEYEEEEEFPDVDFIMKNIKTSDSIEAQCNRAKKNATSRYRKPDFHMAIINSKVNRNVGRKSRSATPPRREGACN